MLAATEEELQRVDFELVDFLEWKRAACPATAAVSQTYAEAWRERQIVAMAVRLVDELYSQPLASSAAQLGLF